jgi:hypothetical protein
MKTLFFFLVVAYGFNVNATMRLVCGAKDFVVGVDCSDQKVVTQYFKAEFEQHGSSNFAYGSIQSKLTPAIGYEVTTVDSSMVLEIYKQVESGHVNSHAVAHFEKEGDMFSTSYSENNISNDSCEDRNYTLLCIYTSKDLDSAKISLDFNAKKLRFH